MEKRDRTLGLTVAPERMGLLVVDIQEKLFSHIADKENLLGFARQAVQVAHRLSMPIFVTEQYSKGLGRTVDEIADPLIALRAYEPIEKRAFSCFQEPAFTDAVEKRGARALAIIGVEAHVCVLQTALDALERGLSVFLIAEAIGSRNPRHKEEAMSRARAAGAVVGSVEMLAFELMRTSLHPAFREVQRAIL